MKTLYFFGDSNTYGFDPSNPWNARYPENDIWTFRVKEAVKQDWTLVADGVNGREIPTGEYEYQALLGRMKQSAQVDLFAVMLGTNDYLNRMEPDADEVAEKMRAFVRRLSEDAGRTDILIVAPPAILIPALFHDPGIDTSGGELSEAYRRVAKEEGCRFLDALLWNCDLAYDGVHLSVKGHHTFAEKFTEYMDCYEP